MSLVVVAGRDLDTAIHAFDAAGYESRRAESLPPVMPPNHLMLALSGNVADELRSADDRGLRYQLVHVGPDDGVPGGSYARAHHRVDAPALAGLAQQLRPRDRLSVICLAFGFKNGAPGQADWVFDARFLDNPYWVPELRDLDGRDPRVQEYVLGQPSATTVLDALESVLRIAIEKGQGHRSEITIAFGCTGGRHRSVALAVEMARRLSAVRGIDLQLRLREL